MTLPGTASPRQRMPGVADYALLIIISAIWGSSFLFIKIGVSDLPAIPFTTLRLVLSALLMAAVAFYLRQRIFGVGMPWPMIWLAALSGNALPFVLIGWGEERIDSSVAAILMAVSPLTTVALAHVFTRDDRLTWGKSAGVVLGILGVVILMGPTNLARIGDETVRQLAVAAAAMCYAINVLITREIQQRVNAGPTALVTAVILVSAAIMLPAQVALSSPNLSDFTWPAVSSAVVMAVFHTAFATILMFVLIERQGPSFFAQVNFLVPVFGVFWGMLALGERLEWSSVLALALILLGMAFARRRSG